MNHELCRLLFLDLGRLHRAELLRFCFTGDFALQPEVTELRVPAERQSGTLVVEHLIIVAPRRVVRGLALEIGMTHLGQVVERRLGTFVLDHVEDLGSTITL